MRSKVYLIDPPSPFAPRAEWEAHLAELKKLSKGRRAPEVKAAIAAAENVLATLPDEGAAIAEAEALRGLFSPAYDGGLAERMDTEEIGAFQPVVPGSKKPVRRAG